MKWWFILLLWNSVLCLRAESVEIGGTVRSLNNVLLAGVNVLVKGTAAGTATDMSGAFRVSVPPGKVVLLFMLSKQKPLEHEFIVRATHQYQINVVLANKTQTFNKSEANTSELPLNAPRLTGKLTDQDGRALAGVTIRQDRSGFLTTSDSQGHFDIPSPVGKNQLLVTVPGFKPLAFPIDVDERIIYDIYISLVKDHPGNSRKESQGRISPKPEGKVSPVPHRY